MNKTIFDSNIWIAFLNTEDHNHNKALEIFNHCTDKIVITEYIIEEVCSVLTIRFSKKLANQFLNIIFDKNNQVELLLSNKDFFYGVKEQFQNSPNQKLSFVDHSLVYLSLEYKITTFDKDLIKVLQ